LKSVARVYVDPGTPELDRENQRLMLSVTARLEGVDLGSGVRAVQGKLKDLPLPPSYSLEYGGLYKSQQESFSALQAVLITAACAVFAVMVLSLRSFRVAFSLFVAAVTSLVGVILALWATHTPLNISSYTGAIMIVGIVTENGILLFDEFRHRRLEQPTADVRDLLRAAGTARLRPILMTTFAAITALFPLALGIGAGAAMQKPLAIAVIGGLAFSTIFTLLLAPTLYASLVRRQRA
jgi:multidrug efflux pump subunit AcrB